MRSVQVCLDFTASCKVPSRREVLLFLFLIFLHSHSGGFSCFSPPSWTRVLQPLTSGALPRTSPLCLLRGPPPFLFLAPPPPRSPSPAARQLCSIRNHLQLQTIQTGKLRREVQPRSGSLQLSFLPGNRRSGSPSPRRRVASGPPRSPLGCGVLLGGALQPGHGGRRGVVGAEKAAPRAALPRDPAVGARGRVPAPAPPPQQLRARPAARPPAAMARP